MTTRSEPTGSQEPIRTRSPEHARVRAVGRLRLPLAGPYQPWATLWRFPDGRLLWSVRLWQRDRPVPHLVPSDTLRSFARRNRLPDVEAAIDALVRAALR
jgi:hypothetical protein